MEEDDDGGDDLGDRHVQDCDIVLAFPPDTPEATVVWLKERIHRLQVRSVLSGQSAFFQGHHKFAPSTLSKNQTKLPQFFNHIFLHMSRKYVSVFNKEYVLDQ